MIENIKAILSNWDDVRIEQNPVYWTIGGVFKGTAHAGTRADPLSLARDLARIAGSDVQLAAAPVVELATVRPQYLWIHPGFESNLRGRVRGLFFQ